ncbi:DUF4184 family protein [Curtobacterium sp. B8]|uniref:DUF4184 family protein n=1 Tax=Curtobacterium sp. B8 TaxID=95611 RepID=UPI00034CE420|nr:DUF4184 family protein [Curtobacterium sp. B8]
MPFTVSHAVVAFAARRTPLPVAAVAVGSMAPDAVLFVPSLPPYAVSHSWTGVVTVDLAVALVLVAVWWWLVRPAWTRALPALAVRVPTGWTTRPRSSARGVAATLVGCVLGSVTHVLWDACSHRDGWVVEAVPVLRGSVARHPVWALVQDGSSALGLLALLVVAVVWWGRSRPEGDRRVPAGGRTGREARLTAATGVAAVVLVTAGRCGAVALAGGGAGAVVVAAAFTVPPVVAVVLVVGAVVLGVVRRSHGSVDLTTAG